jgi:UDP-N-acetylglucosamine 1-carboxyvinyltransferase
MESFIIEGNAPLKGVVTPSGNKNAAFPLVAAALLTDKPVTLHNLPNIGDVRTMLNRKTCAMTATMSIMTLRAGSCEPPPRPGLFAKMRGAWSWERCYSRGRSFGWPNPAIRLPAG